ncbi:hypothetical protein OIU84_011165 [Salix udensis]|uniref:Uncharacterized protein n=1 Tax=Salix udensis TaxID=889485 RepID=A0AAD6JN31_9ROSI|nr:hypothetical protein OIU84_011165 [Salix udensis]
MDHRMICDVLVILMAAVWTLDNSGIAGFGVSLMNLWMMKPGKSFEPDATAAFKKPEQKQLWGKSRVQMKTRRIVIRRIQMGLTQDVFSSCASKDARYCDKASGSGGISIISIKWLENSDLEREKKTY